MRAFVAIEIPRDIRHRIHDLIEVLRRSAADVRWSRPDGLHITLKFLGEVAAPKVPEVESRLRSVRLNNGALPMPIQVQGSGYFPNERSPRVIWLGIHAGPALAAMASQIDEALLPCGFDKEKRPFSPHLTLGRIREPGPLNAVREQLQQRAPLEMGSFSPQEFFLYESKLAPGGSVYRKVSRFPLAAGPDGSR